MKWDLGLKIRFSRVDDKKTHRKGVQRLRNRSVRFHRLEKLINNWPLGLNSDNFFLDRSQKKCSDAEHFLILVKLSNIL